MAGCLPAPRPVLVLHDLPNGAMRHLDAFLGRLRDAGATFRQDFPDSCLPMRRGTPGPALGGYVNLAQPTPARMG